jgi:GH15 family glucan-1,4-alpha-glucosidase
LKSNSDELEGRFPSGKANLSTNCLYYDALVSAAMLSNQLRLPKKQSREYAKQAEILKNNIEKYFGANLAGFETYKYYETNTTLRSWICMPLTMGINERSKGTIDALFSPQLWTADGLATEAGNTTFWDRSTLYALRGVLQAGATEKAMNFLHYYSRRRLLGEHVPYPVEAYPEVIKGTFQQKADYIAGYLLKACLG